MHVCRTERIDAIFMHINQPHSYVRTQTCHSKEFAPYYYFVLLISMSKKSADNDNLPQGKHGLTGFNPEWGSDFQFVLYSEDASGVGGMFCSAVVLLR